MTFIRKYKNILISLGSYILAFLVTYILPLFIWSYDHPPASRNIGFWFVGLSLTLVAFGVFSGFRSIMAKESTWAGHLVAAIGVLSLTAPFILTYLSYRL